jgi:hypothetical protein
MVKGGGPLNLGAAKVAEFGVFAYESGILKRG